MSSKNLLSIYIWYMKSQGWSITSPLQWNLQKHSYSEKASGLFSEQSVQFRSWISMVYTLQDLRYSSRIFPVFTLTNIGYLKILMSEDNAVANSHLHSYLGSLWFDTTYRLTMALVRALNSQTYSRLNMLDFSFQRECQCDPMNSTHVLWDQ